MISAPERTSPETPARESWSRRVVPHWTSIITALALAASFVVWRELHRWWFPMADDYKFTAVTQQPGINFSASQWWAMLVNDWTVRVGRLGDSVFRMIVRPGFDTWRWFAPVLYTLFGLGVGRLLPHRPRSWTAIAASVAGLLVLPTSLLLWPAMTGDAVFWADAAVNYLVPATLMVWILGAYLHLVQNRTTTWTVAAASVLPTVLAAMMHEQTSWALVTSAVVVMIVMGRSMPRPGWLLTGAAVLGFVLQMAAPGLWVRLGYVDPTPPDLDTRLHKLTLSSVTFFEHSRVLWILLTLALVVSLWRRHRVGRVLAALLVAATGALAWCSSGWRARTVENDSMTQPVLPQAAPWQFAATGSFVVLVLLLMTCLWTLRHEMSITAVMLVPASLASFAPIFVTGVLSPRAYLLPLMWLLVAVVALVLEGLPRTGWQEVVAWALSLTILASCSFAWWSPARIGLATNAKFVKTRIMPPIHRAANHKCTVVRVPRPMPAQDYVYGNAFLMPRYEGPMKRYYGLGENVRFKVARPEVIDPRLAPKGTPVPRAPRGLC